MLSHQQLEKLTKADLVNYALNLSDIKEKLTEFEKGVSDRFDSLESEIDEKINSYINSSQMEIKRLESVILVSTNANTLLCEDLAKKNSEIVGRLTTLEREAFRTAEYVNYETLELSKIPLTIPDEQIPAVVLKIMNSLFSKDDEDFTLDDFHAIHRRQGKYTKEKILVKFVRRGDAFCSLRNSRKLRKMKMTNIDQRLTQPIYLNEHLSPYYSKLRYACKILHENGHLNEYWVSGHKIKVKQIANGRVEHIAHKDDLIKSIPSVDISDILHKCNL
jgi:hypothetical protein